MEELPVEDPGHMASAERQLRDWEGFITGKKLTDDTSSDTMISKEQLPKGTRVVRQGREKELGYMPDGITVVIGEDDTVQRVYRG
ncbi:uncharacterized protein DNG_06767 [Cephalotrichum gorgonifer]|uniref:Uncharacterized protein n=1 Tax=Cephalotrichum gorgonifer TaxID=2041049 RepID=A0AAE8N250_9PEZI|nr:uncharacterized protein DNG_06767 [Cephalotrichum gorgonifer]